MKLYFVRHGKTKWNKEGRFQGANGDSPLSTSGQKEIEALADYLKDVRFDHIYSSDLTRAKKTVDILVNKLHLDADITYTESLREWNLGNLEGQKISIMSSIYPKQIDAFYNNLARFNNSMFNAESVYDSTNRVVKFVKEELSKTNDETVLIVGHGANLTAAIRTLLGFMPAELRRKGGLDNGSVTILDTDDFKHFTLEKWNDTSFISLDND